MTHDLRHCKWQMYCNIKPAFNSKLAIQITSNGDSIMEKALTGLNKHVRVIRFVKPITTRTIWIIK